MDEKESTRSLDGSETLDQSRRLLFMRTAGNGGWGVSDNHPRAKFYRLNNRRAGAYRLTKAGDWLRLS